MTLCGISEAVRISGAGSQTHTGFAAQQVRTVGRLSGRLWACQDKLLEGAEVYASDGRAWLIGPSVCGHLDWFDFCRITRNGRQWNVAPAGRAVIAASSKIVAALALLALLAGCRSAGTVSLTATSDAHGQPVVTATVAANW